MNPRMETRSMSRTSSPLTPQEVHPSISWNDEVSTSKKPSSRVIKNHPDSNIIGSLDEGLHFRKRKYPFGQSCNIPLLPFLILAKKGRRSFQR